MIVKLREEARTTIQERDKVWREMVILFLFFAFCIDVINCNKPSRVTFFCAHVSSCVTNYKFSIYIFLNLAKGCYPFDPNVLLSLVMSTSAELCQVHPWHVVLPCLYGLGLPDKPMPMCYVCLFPLSTRGKHLLF